MISLISKKILAMHNITLYSVCMYFFRSRKRSIVSSSRMGTRGQKLVALQKNSNWIDGGLLKSVYVYVYEFELILIFKFWLNFTGLCSNCQYKWMSKQLFYGWIRTSEYIYISGYEEKNQLSNQYRQDHQWCFFFIS